MVKIRPPENPQLFDDRALRVKTRGQKPQKPAISAVEIPLSMSLEVRMGILRLKTMTGVHCTFSCAGPSFAVTEKRKFGAQHPKNRSF